MKLTIPQITLAASFLVTSAICFATDDNEALAQKSGCLACHSLDKKIVGPAYKEVATKYKGDKTAEARLIAKVKAGGSGAWGNMPMPANSPCVNDADIKTLVKWVLAL